LKTSDKMKFEYVITDELGIHARPAGALVELVKKFESNVIITLNDKTADASSIMKLMMLQAKQNDKIIVEVVGSDEKEAADSIFQFMEENF